MGVKLECVPKFLQETLVQPRPKVPVKGTLGAAQAIYTGGTNIGYNTDKVYRSETRINRCLIHQYALLR